MVEEFPAEGEAAEINGMPLAEEQSPEDDLEWPIGFIVVLALAALYLGWRLIQMLGGLLDFIS